MNGIHEVTGSIPVWSTNLINNISAAAIDCPSGQTRWDSSTATISETGGGASV